MKLIGIVSMGSDVIDQLLINFIALPGTGEKVF
jgi:hypothetical protein